MSTRLEAGSVAARLGVARMRKSRVSLPLKAASSIMALQECLTPDELDDVLSALADTITSDVRQEGTRLEIKLDKSPPWWSPMRLLRRKITVSKNIIGG